MPEATTIYQRDRTLLERLISPDFVVSAGVITSPTSLRRWLLNQEVVQVLRLSIAGGIILETQVREFADRLLTEFQRGVRFPHEFALAAIAVAIERRQTPFADEYLRDLARLNIAEMPLAPGVAKECVRRRDAAPQVNSRVRNFGTRDSLSSVRARSVAARVMVHVTQVVIPVLPVPTQCAPLCFDRAVDHA